MPVYTDRDKLREILDRDVSDTRDTAGSLSDEQLDAAIAEAEAEVDGRLGTVYTVPFTAPIPVMIKQITLAIAAYSADLTFREVRDYSSDLNPILLRYQRAQKLLLALASGAMDLPPGTPGPDSSTGPGSVVVVYEAPPALFYESDFDIRPANGAGGCNHSGFCSCYWGSPEMWGIRN